MSIGVNGLTETEEALLSCVANVLFDAPKSIPSNINWQDLLKEAEKQAVLPIAFYNISDAPDDVQQKIYRKTNYNMTKSIQLDYSHSKVHELMSENHIPYVILKGCASASYYPNPMLRCMGDVDFLVSKDHIARADKVLRSEGYSPWNENHICHIVYTKEDSQLEMHFEPAGVPEGEAGETVREFLSDIYEKSEVKIVDGFEMCLPSDFHHGLIILLHTVHHMMSEGVGLRHLLDWAVFVNSLSNDEFRDLFEQKLSKIGLWKTAQLLTLVCNKYLGCAPKECAGTASDDILEGIIKDVLQGGNFGIKDKQRSRAGMILSNRGKNGVGNRSYLVQFFDTLNHIIYTNWPVTKKHRWLLPFGWIFWGVRYQLRVLTGKRKQLGISKMVSDANQRGALYKEFHLYETED